MQSNGQIIHLFRDSNIQTMAGVMATATRISPNHPLCFNFIRRIWKIHFQISYNLKLDRVFDINVQSTTSMCTTDAHFILLKSQNLNSKTNNIDNNWLFFPQFIQLTIFNGILMRF